MIYDRLEEARPLFKPGRFHELRYEELVKDPVGEMEKVYAALELDGFERGAAADRAVPPPDGRVRDEQVQHSSAEDRARDRSAAAAT